MPSKLIDEHKCTVLSRGHDWDGLTCLACGYTTSRIYRERIKELERELSTAKAFIHWVVIERDNLRAAGFEPPEGQDNEHG